jgi:hypothetical protein
MLPPKQPLLIQQMKQQNPNDRYPVLYEKLRGLEMMLQSLDSTLPNGKKLGDLTPAERAELAKDIAEARKFIAAAEGPKKPDLPPQQPLRHFASSSRPKIRGR